MTANDLEAFRSVIGRTIQGVLFDAQPAHLQGGTKTLVFDDGTGLTVCSNGSYWRESKADIERACLLKAKELANFQREMGTINHRGGLNELST